MYFASAMLPNAILFLTQSSMQMKNVNFHAFFFLAKRCLQVFMQLDQAGTKVQFRAKSTTGDEDDVCA